MSEELKIGIIGGTGLDNPDILDNRTEKSVTTPYGDPSSVVVCGTIEGTKCVLLSRHGRGHAISPSYINYRANVCALKQEGCTHIIVTTACGSLKEEVAPGHFVILDQFIDRTFKRHVTFYDQKPGSWEGVSHIPMAHPFCPHLRQMLQRACKLNDVTFHSSGTMITIEGPRFSTYAESQLYRSWGADVINMTTVPEATLAKEAGLLYAALAMATDYDCWKQHEESVSVANVMEVFKKNVAMALKVVQTTIKLIAEQKDWNAEIQKARDVAKNSLMQ